MREADLETFERWLHEPHFARWFLEDSSIEAELAASRRAIHCEEPTNMLIAMLDSAAIGWCQWYCFDDDAEEVAEYEALPGEIGIDYAVGDPSWIGRGIGTQLVAMLVRVVRSAVPEASIMTAPSAANRASCRVLEKNGFRLVDVRDISGEPNASPLAIYRLAAETPGQYTTSVA
jgi:aminoglycoside 6'-N-acetyltransferase